ncbi:MAG: hypothetical protein KJ057_15915 [Phycisphaerae bacterium]|nr:hypothetical protein [Planctomycetia bacterium]MCL4719957.1 hypothetical protein [Phycisphaerae bacterium]
MKSPKLAKSVQILVLASLPCALTACQASAIEKQLDAQAASYAKDRAERPFVGTIAFDFEMTDEAAGTPPTSYTGWVYLGADGDCRLDVLFGKDKPPVICSVLPETAWMVFYRTEHSIESQLPVPPSNDGWANQLRAQVDQTKAWCDLLSGLQVSREIHAFQAPGKQTFASGDSGDHKRLTEVRTTQSRGGLASIELRYANGGRLEAADFREISGIGAIPHKYTRINIADEGRVVKLRFEITEVAPAEDSSFEDFFVPPSRTPQKWPHLWGTAIIEKDGKETLMTWGRGVQVNHSPRS